LALFSFFNAHNSQVSSYFFFYSYMHANFGSFLPPSPHPLLYLPCPLPLPPPPATRQKLFCPYL
jgi:hypothetical protein